MEALSIAKSHGLAVRELEEAFIFLAFFAAAVLKDNKLAEKSLVLSEKVAAGGIAVTPEEGEPLAILAAAADGLLCKIALHFTISPREKQLPAIPG